MKVWSVPGRWAVFGMMFWAAGCEVDPEDLDDPQSAWTDESVSDSGMVDEDLLKKKGQGGTVGQVDYCTNPLNVCTVGEGDCDTNAECASGLICALNNGARFGFPFSTDFCVPPHCESGTLNGDETDIDCGGSCGACICVTGNVGDNEFCTPSCPCSDGEGDCDGNDECVAGTACVNDVGAEYGQIPTNDVCVATDHCDNGVKDVDEVDIDCGGTGCSACVTNTFERINRSSGAAQSNGETFLGFDASADGRFVVFGSRATNMVTGDTNSLADIFVHERHTNATGRPSVSSSGTQGNDDCTTGSISDSGRYIAFSCRSSNLVTGDTNGRYDIFLRDRFVLTTTRISLGAGGVQATGGPSTVPMISGNGRYVVYESSATNLVPDDTNGAVDIFVTDRTTLVTTRVSVANDGSQLTGNSSVPSISDDGSMVAFVTLATNVGSPDSNNKGDVYVRNISAGTTTLVSANSAGTGTGADASIEAFLTGGGRYVVFRSFASNLVAGDTNGTWDIFRRDLQTGTTVRVSVSDSEAQTNGSSLTASASRDGNKIAFASLATNLVTGDTNAKGDCFVRDVSAGTTTRYLAAADGACESPLLSASGSTLFARHSSPTLIIGDTNGINDIFAVPVP